MQLQSRTRHQALSLHDRLSMVSNEPGVYLMKDAGGKVIYVGKARNLKKRLGSYFKTTDQLNIKTGVLVKKISTFETILTGTEKEALILEATLIKRYRPRYNVILKDDKRYPSLRLYVNTPFPNLSVVRKIKKDGAMYFGPYSSSQAVRQTLKVIHKTFKLRKCKTRDFKGRARPCLNHQIGSCLAPCCLDVDKNRYKEIVKEVILFLKGRTPGLILKIKKEMMAAAEQQEYERAAVLRDKMLALEKTLEKQIAVSNDFKDRDVLALAGTPDFSLITLLIIRGGFLLGSRHFTFSETLSTDAEVIGTFVRQYYEHAPLVPGEILAAVPPEDALLLEDWLKSEREEKVKLFWPKKGEKARLLQIAFQNAENELESYIASVNAQMDILVRLQEKLKMDNIPECIECFDSSSLSGKEAVAGMVVFEKGKPNRSLYRKYRIRTVAAQDDYAYLAEVLKRRYGQGEKSRPFPDILLIDGGKGQLNMAVSVINSLKIEENFKIVSIAKKDEKKKETQDKIYEPGRANPVNLGRKKDLLLFLERIRDESHRFAVSFHRKRRIMTYKRSVLDSIPGVGKKRRATLLGHFGSIKKIRAARLEELCALPGMNRKVGKAVKNALVSKGETGTQN